MLFFCRGQAAWFWDFSRLTIIAPLESPYILTSGGDSLCASMATLPIRWGLAWSIHLETGCRPPKMQAFNRSMSKVREAVEWLFNDVAKSWKFIDFKKNLKMRLSSVGKMYLVCAILRNVLTSLYGNMTSEYFDLDPTALQDYFIETNMNKRCNMIRVVLKQTFSKRLDDLV